MESRPASAIAAPPVIKLPAEIDTTNCDELASELSAACVPGVSVVIADLGLTTFCDSSAVRVLLQAHKIAASQGIDFEIVVNSPSVLRVLELTGLTTILRLHPSMDAAVTACRDSH